MEMLLKVLIPLCIMYWHWELCVASNANIPQNQFLSSIDWDHWNYIDARNLKIIIIENFVDNFRTTNKLHNVTTSVIPSLNIADDPLNQFVDVKYLDNSITEELLKDAPAKTFQNSATTVSSLLKEIMLELNPRLDEATQKRLEVLINLGKERRNMELQTVLKAIRKIIDNYLANESAVKQVHFNQNSEEWQGIVEKIHSSNLAIEIKKVVSYPVVKEQIYLELKDFDGDIKETTARILETLTPFLLQGLEKKDEAIIGKYTDEVAKRELVRKLVPFYKKLIEQAAAEAKRADSFLLEMYRNRDDLLRTFLGRDTFDEFIRLFRQGTSVRLTYINREHNHDGAIQKCGSPMESPMERTIWSYLYTGYNITYGYDEVRERTMMLLSAFINDEKYNRRDAGDTLIFARYMIDIAEEFTRILVKECESHLEQHEKFVEGKNLDRMVESINTLLEYKHTEIQNSDIRLLKTQFDKHERWYKMTREQYEPDFPDKVLKFKADLEYTAENEYGFSPGAFVYSQNYFDILGKISPSSREKNKHARSEL